MNKLNFKQGFIILAIIFVISFVCSLIATYPNFDSSYDIGYTTGNIFRGTLKLIGSLVVIVYCINMIKRRGEKRLN
jgi:hypothetical protein